MAASIRNRAVITGIGIVSCLGADNFQVYQQVLQKITGTVTVPREQEWLGIPCTVAGLIPQDDLNLSQEFTAASSREMSKPILYAMVAARRALKDSGYRIETDSQANRSGVSIGMGMPDLQEIFEVGQLHSEKGYRHISPYFIPRNLVNMAAGHISIESQFRGPNLCASTACTTGLHSIGDAFRLIQRGDADVMMCGSTEAPVCPLSMAGFSRMRALCVDSNASPETASRPFDKTRNGFVMSEGSAVMVIESEEHAKSRNARIYAEILGYGLSGDAHHISMPSGDGAYRCMDAALKDSKLSVEDVSYVNAHATSTPIGDKAEGKAIHRLFCNKKHPVYVSSLKGSLGHLLGAAGSIESAVTALACFHGHLPPTANLTEPDVQGHFIHVIESQKPWLDERRIAMTNSFGFGGTNASLCISSYDSK